MKTLVTDIEFQSADHVIEEIRNMNVKGGSPFGRAAAWAMLLACRQETLQTKEALKSRIEDLKKQMLTLKPTMGTIHNSCRIIEDIFRENEDKELSEIKTEIIKAAERIIRNSHEAADKLGEIGARLIHDGSVILMHSYSSSLMSVFLHASEAGKKFTVICTESRPLRESRKAVACLQELDQNIIFITDMQAYEFMKKADFVITGADTLCSDGSAANKVGTALLAQLARSCQKPFYIASELYKYNPLTKLGYPVELEQRQESEITADCSFESRKNLRIVNQFFDLTPAADITALICEYGMIHPACTTFYWDQLSEQIKHAC